MQRVTGIGWNFFQSDTVNVGGMVQKHLGLDVADWAE